MAAPPRLPSQTDKPMTAWPSARRGGPQGPAIAPTCPERPARAACGAVEGAAGAGALGTTRAGSTALTAPTPQPIRQRREKLRNVAARHSPGHPVQGCMRTPWSDASGLPSDVAVTTRVDEHGSVRAGFSGLMTCGSRWACPTCAAQAAGENVRQVGACLTWAREQGFSLAMVTLTVRHSRVHPLSQVWDAVSAGAASISGGTSWAGETADAYARRLRQWEIDGLGWDTGYRDRAPRGWAAKTAPARRVGLAEQHGVVAMLRAVEVTVSRHAGWHVHTHYVVALNCSPSQADSQAQALGKVMFERWEKGLAKVGMTAIRGRGGLDVRVVRGSEATLADYLAKGAFGSESEAGLRADLAEPVEGLAREAALGALKSARGAGGRHPFELLADLGRHEKAGTLETTDAGRRDLALWREWVEVSRRRRQLIVDDTFRPHAAAAIAEADAEADEAAASADTVLVIPSSQWSRLLRSGASPLSDLLTIVETEGPTAAVAWLWTVGVNARLPAASAEIGAGPSTFVC